MRFCIQFCSVNADVLYQHFKNELTAYLNINSLNARENSIAENVPYMKPVQIAQVSYFLRYSTFVYLGVNSLVHFCLLGSGLLLQFDVSYVPSTRSAQLV